MSSPPQSKLVLALPPAQGAGHVRLEPGAHTTAMRHRRPGADCPLCPLWGVAWDPHNPGTHNRQHVHAEALWRAWNGGHGSFWASDVCTVAAELGAPCTLEQAKKHFHYHRVEQPALSGQMRREALLYESGLLSRRAQAIITAVYRHRIMTGEQLQEVFFRPTHTRRSAVSACQAELTALCARHFLYRLYPDEKMAGKKDAPKNFAKQALWLLGKASLPLVEERYGAKVWRDHYVQMAKEVSHVKVMHDLRANEVYVRLARALREQQGLVEFPGNGLAAVELRTDNWYGDKSLALAFYDTAHRTESEIRADGFASLSVQRNRWDGDGGLPSCQMPFFYEYDRGSKDTGDVARQLLAYHLLARARKAAERFPDLSVDGYAVPVLMVFSEGSRLRNAHRAFLALAAQENLPQGVPIVLVAEADWAANPLAPDICTLAWDEQARKFSFLDLLLRASQPLIKSRAVLSSRTLAVDLKAARRTTGAVTADALAQQRSRRADQRETLVTERRLEREAAQRQERLASLRPKADSDGNPLALGPSTPR